MRDFEFVAARTLGEAIDALARANGGGRALAGGTDLIAQIKEGRRSPSVVVDIKGIPELNVLECSAEKGLRLGAAVTCSTIVEHPLIQQLYPMLVYACGLVGSVQIQNRAGVGGNFCNAAPSADTAPPVICLGTACVIAGPKGRREVAAEEFFKGPGQSVLEPHEVLVEFVVPPPAPNSAGQYLRFIPREEMDIAVAGVGSFVVLDAEHRTIQETRICLCAVAPTPVHAKAAEDFLRGKPVSEGALKEASRLAVEAAKPINDVRGSIEYRKHLVNVLTQRTLHGALRSLEAIQ
ncbi:MAG: xanthine dehydrogenase family protein subunit M [Nitrospinae bacterium]|nr:xanthine dehydrogenase family protein subunit M [Nitrospinota bacterium]